MSFTVGTEGHWHRFKTTGLTAYQVHQITDWLVDATGGRSVSEFKDRPDCPAWSYAIRNVETLHVVGYRFQRYMGTTTQCEFYVNTDELAQSFRDIWCSQELEDAMRQHRLERAARSTK